MALDGHGFETFCHIGFVHALQVHRHIGFFEQQLCQTAQIGAGAISQERQGLTRRARQHEHRLAIGIRLGVGCQQFFAQSHHFIARGVELERLGAVVVGNQQIAAAFHQAHDGIVHIQRNQAAFERAKLRLHLRHPVGKEGKGQRVRHGKTDHAFVTAGVGAEHGARALQRLQHLQRLVVHGLPCRRQARGVRAAIDQIGTSPRL